MCEVRPTAFDTLHRRMLRRAAVCLAAGISVSIVLAYGAAPVSTPTSMADSLFLGDYVGTFHPVGEYGGKPKPEDGKDFKPRKCGTCHTEASIARTKDGFVLSMLIDHDKDKDGKPKKERITLKGERHGDVLAFGDGNYTIRAGGDEVTGSRTGRMAAEIKLRRKPSGDAAVEEQYQALVAKLPPDQQAWEHALQANLGSYYLPIHKREKVKGVANAWDYVKDDPRLPRVLLIGDSVSRGYTMPTRKALAGKANVHRAPENCGPTSNGLKKLDVWLGDGKWDVIHFNFGIHDRVTPPEVYEERLEKIAAKLQKTGAKLIWASTTPIPKDDAKKQTPESIVERNAIAARVMQKHGVAVDDLFTFITPHLATVQNPNDVHFNAKGYELLGKQVAESVLAGLKTGRP